MDAEIKRIWDMVGELCEAHWRRATQPGVRTLDALLAIPYRPESAEERAIWTELTAPHNYLSLRRFVEYRKALGSNEFGAKLDEDLLAEATSRREKELG
jgi:hypothetical protein